MLKIRDKNDLEKENISLENITKEFDSNKNDLEKLKKNIEKEILEINKDHERVLNEIIKTYEIKHQKLIKEELDLKNRLNEEVTTIKNNMELNLSKINNILTNYEKIKKTNIYYYRIKEEQIITKLNYISDINKTQKEMKELFNHLMQNYKISYDGYNIKYDQYYFNGIPIPKNINFSNIRKNSFKILWNIDINNATIPSLDNNQIRYQIIIRKERGRFIPVYEGKNNFCTINNLEQDTKYEIKICTIYQNMKSDYTKIFQIETNGLNSKILSSTPRKKEFINKIMEWTGFKFNKMKLLYRGTKDGMTSFDFHNRCDNKGNTICLFMNNRENIFGGYSPIPWTKNGGEKISNECFLFSLSNIYNTEPIKFPYLKERSVFLSEDYGPVFGYGADLFCKNNFFENNSNGTRFPYSYKDTYGKGKSIFTGDCNNDNTFFILKEIEVFELFN